jgi:hypothetical protein
MHFWGSVSNLGLAMNDLLAILFAGIIFLGLPTVTIWGWLRWSQRRDTHEFFAIVALLAFAGATLSGLFALFAVGYVQARHITAFDIRWIWILRIGLLVSAPSFALSLLGILRRSSIRWHALFCATSVLSIWFFFASLD